MRRMQTAGAGIANDGAGWLPEERRGAKKLVWARGRVATEECPKSLVTPQSLEWLERFLTLEIRGGGGVDGAGGAGSGCVFDAGKGVAGWRAANPLSNVTKLLGTSGASASAGGSTRRRAI